MNWIDFFTGWFLMNAMPHFVFGVWHQRVLSLFGFGDKQNILYAAFNTSVSLGLFHWNHGIENLLDQLPYSKLKNFYSALADVGMGRDITAYLSPFVG